MNPGRAWQQNEPYICIIILKTNLMSILTQKEAELQSVHEDFLPLNGTDYVELYVSNSKQAAHYYKTAFGFQSWASKGLETGE